MTITHEIINEIRKKTDIISVISNYLPLTQRGKNYFGVCPFHDDHSPSMSVSPEKQIYTCFSCGATGNVFNFVANYEHIGFYDAVRMLGNRLGYNLGNEKVINNKYSEFYQIYDIACKFYQNNLNSSIGKPAVDYLEKRKIDKATIKKFKIGLSTQTTSLTDYLVSKGYDLKTLVDLGLSNNNGSDLFVNRIMFPLFDNDGNIVAFSGRIYNTTSESKYINTKETIIFKKGNIMYNFHNANEPLKKNDTIIVMEGFMDVIRASCGDINNCIAVMGTALTKQNATILKKMAKNIILCFDGDKAGEEATTSAINVFKTIDVSPKVIRLEENLDPDEYILKYGYDRFKAKINNPESAIEFLMNEHKNNKNLTNIEDITKYINEALADLIMIDDEITVDLTLKKLSLEYQVEYTTLKNRYNKLKNIEKNKSNTEENKIVTSSRKKINQYDLASRNLLFYMLKNTDIIEEVSKKIAFFPDSTIRELANEIIYYYEKYGTFKIADFISYINSMEEASNLLNEINLMPLKEEYTKEEIEDYIKVVNSYPIKNKIISLNKQLHSEKDPLKQAEILNEILSLKGVKKWLKK